MTGLDETVAGLMGPTAVVQLVDRRLELFRHPADGRAIAFESSGDAFAFALSLELRGASSVATVAAPAGEPLHMLEPGLTAFDLIAEEAA